MVICTSLVGSASLPPARTIRVKETLGMRFVAVIGDKAWTTKLNFVSCFGSSACPSLEPPMTQRLACAATLPPRQAAWRSEEHTSEIQSHLNLVFRLLL